MFGLVPFRSSQPLRYGSPFTILLREMEEMLDRSFSGSLPTVSNEGFFAQPVRADVRETESEYILEADLPGFDKDEINVEISDGCLSIKAERKEEISEENKEYIRRERKYKSAMRSFYIDDIDQAKVKATHNNGVLKLVLPKLAKGSSAKRIAIE